MGKKKGSKASASSLGTKTTTANDSNGGVKTNANHATTAAAAPLATTSAPLGPHDALYAVVEFHHMLIGNSHKKEAAALNAAASHGIVGCIYMGGPSLAIVQAACLDDLLDWLSDCKKAGKEGNCIYWKPKAPSSSLPSSNKLKVMPYAPGKDTKMDVAAYKATLAQIGIPFPLPACPLLLQ